jgi:hypothetical protein
MLSKERSRQRRDRVPRCESPGATAFDSGGILREPVAGCAHTTPPPVSPFRPRSRRPPVTSNVGQNYPYTSESESERAASIETLVRDREGLADNLKSEATALDANERWWVWKCPTAGCSGLLHVAGYSQEKHAVVVVCDGTCGKIFLR